MNINAMMFVAPNLAGGEAQWPRAAPRSGAVTDEQRSHRPNSAQPAGRQVFFAQTSLLAPQSLFGNYEGRCGEGFWLWPRRRVPRIPAAGCKERANAGHGQKTRRPEGFRGKGRLASLLLSRRSTRDILLRRASPSDLFPENSAPRSFQTGSYEPLGRVRGAFTLVEYVIGIGIGSLVLLTILSLSLYSGKSFAGLANYVK